MTNPCEHCHFAPDNGHPFFRILFVLVVIGVLYSVLSELEAVDGRVRKLETAEPAPPARRRTESKEKGE